MIKEAKRLDVEKKFLFVFVGSVYEATTFFIGVFT